MSVDSIVKQAEALSRDERRQLVKRLIDTLHASEPEASHSILEYEGIAAHLADDEDPQNYVNRLRDEWGDRP